MKKLTETFNSITTAFSGYSFSKNVRKLLKMGVFRRFLLAKARESVMNRLRQFRMRFWGVLILKAKPRIFGAEINLKKP
jgi:hypothetical protein